MIDFQNIKKQNQTTIDKRHLYVSNIIKNIFNPKNYNYLCEIGAGDMELAQYLSKYYENIDAYESFQDTTSKISISNLQIYGGFNKYTNISKYDLILSVCPYCYDYNSDENDPEEDTNELLQDIIDLCVEYDKDLFLILADTYNVTNFLDCLLQQKKYRKIISDSINLHYKKMDNDKISEHKVLILKKQFN